MKLRFSHCQLLGQIFCFPVFYVRTIQREISLPLAWYPTHVTPPVQLAMIFWKLLYECETRGVQVHAVVADAFSTNRNFFKLVSGVSTVPLCEPFTAPNPYAPDRPVCLCSDPSHLLKTARNSLLSSKPGGKKYMNFSGKDILWTHIVQLYEVEKSSLALSRTRLTDAHLKLDPHSKVCWAYFYYEIQIVVKISDESLSCS